MEKVACGFSKTAHKEVFVSLTMNLDDIGPYCTGLGILRSTIADGVAMPSVRLDLSHGAVGEMADVYSCTHSILNCLFPDKSADDWKDVVKKITTQIKRLKSKKKAKLGEYLVQKVTVSTDIVELEAEGEGENMADNSVQCNLLGKQNAALQKEVQRLRAENVKLKEKLDSECSEDVMSGKVDELLKIDEKLSALKAEYDVKCGIITDLEHKISVLTNDSVSLHTKLREANDMLRKLKNGAVLKKQRRKIKYMSEKELKVLNEIDDARSKMNSLTCQLKKSKKDLRASNSKVIKYRTDKHFALKKITTLSNELKETIATLLDLQSEHIHTRKESRGAPFSDNIQKCIMQLVGELDIPTTKVSQVVQSVSKWLYDKDIDKTELPSTATANNFVDIAQVLGKYQLAEELVETDRWDLHGDGTSRDSKKIIGQQVTLNNGKSLSAGFSPVAVEDSSTLLENVISMMDELSYVYDEENREAVYKIMIDKMFSTMSDRSSVNKKFNEDLNKHRKDISDSSSELIYLYCNAHFLLGLSHKCESILLEFEKKLEAELGRPLGRNNNAKFKNWHSSESHSARYVRTASDVLGPRGDQKNGCPSYWNAYLSRNDQRSSVTSFRSNRFNNFFEGSRGLFHHQSDIVDFLSEYKGDLNLKLQSVLLDASSVEIQSLIRALGIVFCKITGPWWEMLNGGVEYVDQYKYIQTMLSKFRDWSTDASELLEAGCGIFPDYLPPKSNATATLFNPPNSCSDANITKHALESMMIGFIQVTEKQLADFLPGGEFGSEPSTTKRAQMKHCKVTNLLSEHEFGDLDFSQFRRRHASLYYHSGIQILKQNHTISKWLAGKPENEQSTLLKMARTKSGEMRKRHVEKERHVIRKTRERLESNFSDKKAKEAKRIENQNKLMASLKEHCGPCQNVAQINAALASCKNDSAKKELMKNEFRYLTNILGIKDKRLVMGNKGWKELKDNWCLVKGVADDPSIPTDTIPTSSSITVLDDNHEEEISNSQRKRKHGSTELDNFESRKKCKTADVFRFSNQGIWVAVAYDDDFFIGTVLDVENFEVATVQFLNRGFQTTYRWPRIDDVAEVRNQFVFASDVEVVLNANGRTYSVSEIDYLQQLYEEYAAEYF